MVEGPQREPEDVGTTGKYHTLTFHVKCEHWELGLHLLAQSMYF